MRASAAMFSCSFQRYAASRAHCFAKGSPERDVLRQRNLLPQHNTFKGRFQVRSISDVSEPMPRKQFPANIVGPQIRKARYQLGLSQEQLATRCQLLGLDISRSTLAQVEIRMRYVSDGELLVFASILNVSTDELFPPDAKRRFVSKLSKASRLRTRSGRQ
jgi:ribosome-binding protein aMBF1 (putative translation factor)